MFKRLKNILRITVAILFVFFSLLVFPSGLPFLVFAWFCVGIIVLIRNGRASIPVLLGLGLLVLKRPGWTCALALLIAAGIGFCWVRFRYRTAIKNSLAWKLGMAVGILTAWVIYSVDRYSAATSSRSATLDDRPIACLGDSLTAFGYPQQLSGRLSVPVADFGVSGIDSTEALEMLPEILQVNPQAVVIAIGGHDYNKEYFPGRTLREKRQLLEENLRQLIESLQQKQTRIVLVEIPRGLISDPFDGIERELAREYDLELISDTGIRQIIFFSPIIPPGSLLDQSKHLSADGLHPNQNGNRLLARIVAGKLSRIFGESILNPKH